MANHKPIAWRRAGWLLGSNQIRFENARTLSSTSSTQATSVGLAPAVKTGSNCARPPIHLEADVRCFGNPSLAIGAAKKIHNNCPGGLGIALPNKAHCLHLPASTQTKMRLLRKPTKKRQRNLSLPLIITLQLHRSVAGRKHGRPANRARESGRQELKTDGHVLQR